MIAEKQPILSAKKYLPEKTYLSKKKDDYFNQISIEYSLKRNNFNPNNSSPNLFINKLKKRFSNYYELQ